MLKGDASVRNLLHRLLLCLHFRHFRKDTGNTVCGCLSNHDHNKDEGNHHQGHHDLHSIDDHACHLSCLHGSKDNAPAADCYQKDDHYINYRLHYRRIPCHNPFSLCKKLVNVLGYIMELTDFIIFPYKRFYHSGSVYIFLYRII